ncbi:MAG: hypothetical protein ACREQ5_16820 [Candidatus Dormibacteria bacterium]
MSYAVVDVSGPSDFHDEQVRQMLGSMTAVLRDRGYEMSLHPANPDIRTGEPVEARFIAQVGTDQWPAAQFALHAWHGYMGSNVLLTAEQGGDALGMVGWGCGDILMLRLLIRSSGVEEALGMSVDEVRGTPARDDFLNALSDAAFCLQHEYGQRFEPLGVAPDIFGGVMGGGPLRSFVGFSAEVLGPRHRGAYTRIRVRQRRRFSSDWKTLMTLPEAEAALRSELDSWLVNPPWAPRPR